MIVRLLAKRPGERYRRAEEVAADLARYRSGQPAATGPVLRRRTSVLRHDAPPEPAPRRGARRWAVGVAVADLLAGAAVTAAALWPDAESGERDGAPRIRPVTALTTEGRCAGVFSAEIVIRWSPTASRFADGYDVYRSTENGGQYDRVAFVPGRNSTGYVDREVDTGETYFYVVKATAGRHDSASNQVQADTPSVCLF